MIKNRAVQLWGIHDQAEADVVPVLRNLHQIGLNGAELFCVPDMPSERLGELLDELDMKIPSVHIWLEKLETDWEKLCDYFLPLGSATFVMPGYHCHDEEEYESFKRRFSEIGAKIRSRGGDLYYHNHIVEFTDLKKEGKPYWERLAEDCPDIRFQLDAYWAYNAGYDPAALLLKYAPVIKSLHVKDGLGGEEYTDIGKGKLDIPALLNTAEKIGLDWLILENDAPSNGTYAFCENSLAYIDSLNK